MTTKSEKDKVVTPKALEGVIDFCLEGVEVKIIEQFGGHTKVTDPEDDQEVREVKEEVHIDEQKPKAISLPDTLSREASKNNDEQPLAGLTIMHIESRTQEDQLGLPHTSYLANSRLENPYRDPVSALGNNHCNDLYTGDPFEDDEQINYGSSNNLKTPEGINLGLEHLVVPLDEEGAKISSIDRVANVTSLPVNLSKILEECTPTEEELAANAKSSANNRLTKQGNPIIPLTDKEKINFLSYRKKLRILKKLPEEVKKIVKQKLAEEMKYRKMNKAKRNPEAHDLSAFLQVMKPTSLSVTQSGKTNEKNAKPPDLVGSCSEPIGQETRGLEVRNGINVLGGVTSLGDDVYGHFVDIEGEESLYKDRILGDEQFHVFNPFEDMEMSIVNEQPIGDISTEKIELQSLVPLDDLSPLGVARLKPSIENSSGEKTAAIPLPDQAYINELLKKYGPTDDERAANAKKSESFRRNEAYDLFSDEEKRLYCSYISKVNSFKKLNIDPRIKELVYKELKKQVVERRKRKNLEKKSLSALSLVTKKRRQEGNHSCYTNAKRTAKKGSAGLKK